MSKTFQDLLKYAKEQLFVSIESEKKYQEYLDSINPKFPLEKLKTLGIDWIDNFAGIHLAPHELYQKIQRHIESLHEEKDIEIINLLKEYRDKKWNFQKRVEDYSNDKSKYNNLTNLRHTDVREPYFSKILRLSEHVFLTTMYDSFFEEVQKEEMYVGFYIPKSVAFRFTDYVKQFNDINYVVCEDTIKKFTEEQINKIIDTCENNWKELHIVLRDILKYNNDTQIFDSKVSHRKYIGCPDSYPNFPFLLYKDYKHLFSDENEQLVYVYLSYSSNSKEKRDLYEVILRFFE